MSRTERLSQIKKAKIKKFFIHIINPIANGAISGIACAIVAKILDKLFD